MSIKIIMASKSEMNNRELQILQTLAATGNSDHSGRKHVSQLLDWFYHDGPNGRHLCMVLNLLGPSVSAVAERCPNYRLDGNLARRVSRQLLYATDYLHSCGVAHGGRFSLIRLHSYCLESNPDQTFTWVMFFFVSWTWNLPRLRALLKNLALL